MFQKVVLPIIITLFSYVQSAEHQPIVVVFHHADKQHSQSIKGIASTTTIAQLKQAIANQFSPFTIPANAQTLSVQKGKSCWFCPCKKIQTTRLLDNDRTCAAYGISTDTIIKLEVDFVTTAQLQGCQLGKEERKATNPAQPSIFRIPAQQLSMTVPKAQVCASSSDEKQNP